MSESKYLNLEEIVAINKIVVEMSGGTHGLRDRHLLESIVAKPRAHLNQMELYPDILLKSAVFFEALVNYHVFVDGNKRTAFVCMVLFLNKNGLEFKVKDQEIVELCVNVATKEQTLVDIVNWLNDHIQ